MNFVGIDVAGSKKGFHAATLYGDEPEIKHLLHAFTPAELCAQLQRLNITPTIIAIDCPPKCSRAGKTTRLAERQLHKIGYRVQWTRSCDKPPQEWMQNGEALWNYLRNAYPAAELIETFPTVAGQHLGISPVIMPLRIFETHAKRRDWKDLVDACICADVAARYARQQARSVGESTDGTSDELGPIYY